MSDTVATPTSPKESRVTVFAAEFQNYEVVLCSLGLPMAEKITDCGTGKLVRMEARPGSWFELRPKPSRASVHL